MKGRLKKRMIIIPGTLSKLTSIVLRILPRRLVVYFYDRQEAKVSKKVL